MFAVRLAVVSGWSALRFCDFVVVGPHCGSCEETPRLAAEARKQFTGVNVELIDEDSESNVNARGQHDSCLSHDDAGYSTCRRRCDTRKPLGLQEVAVVMKRPNDEIKAIGRDDRIRVQKPEHLALSSTRASIHLQSTSAFRRYDHRPACTGDFARVVIASTIDDNDLRARGQARDRVKRRANRVPFIKRRDDDRYHCFLNPN